MSSENIVIYENDKYHLRAINSEDIELMRKWKNKNKHYYFHSTKISVDQQLKWFYLFCHREDDHMYVVEELCGKKPYSVGVMGWRNKDHYADIYNIMRGGGSLCDGYSMGQALRLMISYIRSDKNLNARCVVLKNNPAVDWYKVNGMEIIGEDLKAFNLEFQNHKKLSEYKTKEIGVK
jgi:RimJ/RimL family protein N-acetyltransferase